MLRHLRLLALTLSLYTASTWAAEPASPAAAAQPPHLRGLTVRNLAGKSMTFTPDEFAKLPGANVRDKVPHSDQEAVYAGVSLHEILRAAGVPFEDPASPAKAPAALRSAYVMLEAADGYQVVFSIPEVLPRLGGREVLLANRMNGEPLPAKAAPYQLIVPGAEGFDRWIRQVTRILVQPGTASPFPPPDAVTAASPATKEGRSQVYLVGTGPGAPDLISVKAAGVLRRAGLVICFNWMKDELAPFVQPGVVEVASPLLRGGQYCGQKPETVSAELRDLVVRTNEEFAKLKTRVQQAVAAGQLVVFADNGDPLLFSPWAWVPAKLAEFQPVVIPGISSFNAGNAVLQQGVTGSGWLLLSGGSELGTPDAQGRLPGTIAFFTHHSKVPELLPQLQAKYPADTPVAIVCDVTYPAEKVLRGTLGKILDTLGREKLPQLYLFYVGDGLAAQAGCH